MQISSIYFLLEAGGLTAGLSDPRCFARHLSMVHGVPEWPMAILSLLGQTGLTWEKYLPGGSGSGLAAAVEL